MLAQHLEAIEADMLEREATFTQVTKERDAMQEALKTQGIDLQNDLQRSSATTDYSNEGKILYLYK